MSSLAVDTFERRSSGVLVPRGYGGVLPLPAGEDLIGRIYRSVKHSFVSGKAAAADATVVDGPDWDAYHVDDYPPHGAIAGGMGDGDPGRLLMEMQQAGNITATPTQWGATVARCSFFTLREPLTVNKIRFYGIGAPAANIHHVAIYRWSDLARLTADLAFTPAANAFGAAGSALNLALARNTLYFMAASVTTTGTVQGPAAVGGTVTSATGQVQVAPGSWPGNLDADALKVNGGFFQFAVTAGALPNPAAAPAAQSAWTGGMPAFWLDNSNA